MRDAIKSAIVIGVGVVDRAHLSTHHIGFGVVGHLPDFAAAIHIAVDEGVMSGFASDGDLRLHRGGEFFDVDSLNTTACAEHMAAVASHHSIAFAHCATLDFNDVLRPMGWFA